MNSKPLAGKSTPDAHAPALVRHVLPGEEEEGADTSWFSRQNAFEQSVIRQQVKFKREVLGIPGNGRFTKQPEHSYPHILPDGDLRRAFYPGHADEIMSYLEKSDIQPHTELLNLKSSQAACLNFLFPLRANPDLATQVLTRAGIVPSGGSVTGIEFEYTAQDEAKKERGCTEWLGEPPGGKRGQNRTSIDAAIFWTHDGRKGATLVEWKYCERTFGSCSAYDQAGEDGKAPCDSPDHESHCILKDGRRNHARHYWDRLEESGIRRSKLACVSGCPFRGPFYQLMRQFLVAQYMRQARIVDQVDVAALHFRGNDALRELPAEFVTLLGGGQGTVIEAWNRALDGVPPMRELDAESLICAYDNCPGQTDPTWRAYIRDRYGL